MIWLVFFLFQTKAFGFADNSYYVGLGYFSENSLGKQTQNPTGTKSFLGTTSLPLLFKYDWKIHADYFVSPMFTYTLLTRNDPANSAKVTIWHLLFPVGGNIPGSTWDWYAGLGIINRNIKGTGGTTELSNGTSTATFSLPGRSVDIRNYTISVGSSYFIGPSRLGMDLITEGTLSSKRNINLMFSYAYIISGGSR